jgi:hypothetical protein
MQRSDVMKLLASAPLVATIALTATSAVHAQVSTFGTVRGIVKDASGNALAGASVVLKPAGNGPALTSTTDGSGAFEFQGVQAGNYNITATSGTLVKTEAVTVTQDTVSSLSFALESGTSTVTVSVAPVHRGQSNTQQNISKRAEQLVKSQPNALYQMPGLVFGQPGITPDSGGYVHIDGGDYNQVGFQVDGIPITEPLGNGFATNIVTVGLKSANLLTGGADASYGNGVGFLNETTQNGRDAKGGIFEYTAGPGQGWDYTGSQIEYGNVTGNGKFDYYLGTILFNNKFPDNTQISKLSPSNDELLKFNYYANPKDTFTVYLNNGHEKYSDYIVPQSAAAPSYVTYNVNTGVTGSTPNLPAPISDQRYDLHYFNYQHKFSDRSFANFKVYDLFNRLQRDDAANRNLYESEATKQNGYFLDYSNQIAKADTLKLGYQYIDGSAFEHLLQNLGLTALNAAGLPNSATTNLDRVYSTKPKTTTFYINNTLRAFQDKATLDLGLRHSQMKIGLSDPNFLAFNGILPAGANTVVAFTPSNLANLPGQYNYPKSHTVSYTDPRIGATYSPSKTLVFRTSYGQNSEFPDTRRVEVLPGAVLGYPQTSVNQNSQVNRFLRNYAPYSPLGAIHTKSFDIGAEKGFNLNSFLNGSYTFALNGFRRNGSNQIQQEAPNYANLGVFSSTFANSGRPYYYTNEGHSHTSGFDMILNKRLVKKSDWNGFASYTNLTARGTSTDYDTGYLPYYVNYLLGTPGLTDANFRQLINSNEVSTSWDQKHTVAIVANKRVWKFFDTTVFMDAGSGFPLSGGVGSNDAQHQSYTTGTASFNEVPVVVNGNALQSNNVTVGRTGWHYKFTLNSNFHIKEDTTLFLNIDNVFTRKTATVLATTTLQGQQYYHAPSAAFPQGQIYYGAQTVLTPRFLSFGVRTKF